MRLCQQLKVKKGVQILSNSVIFGSTLLPFMEFVVNLVRQEEDLASSRILSLAAEDPTLLEVLRVTHGDREFPLSETIEVYIQICTLLLFYSGFVDSEELKKSSSNGQLRGYSVKITPQLQQIEDPSIVVTSDFKTLFNGKTPDILIPEYIEL